MDGQKPDRNKSSFFKYAAGFIALVIIFSTGYFVAETKAGSPDLLSQIGAATGDFLDSAKGLINWTFFGANGRYVDEVSLGRQNDISGDVSLASEGEKELCSFEIGDTPHRGSVLINEVAWMGANSDANAEWIEIKNITDEEINISNWQLVDKDSQIKISFPNNSIIKKDGFYLLSRKGDFKIGVVSDLIYQGNLRNQDEGLKLFNRDCVFEDGVFADPNWPAGKNIKGDKRTMERNIADFSWHTSGVLDGTPKKENSIPIVSQVNKIPSPANGSSGVASANNQSSGNVSSSSLINDNLNKTSPTICSQENLGQPTREILINEVAWSGTASDKTSDEWIELKNNSNTFVNFGGWQLLNKDISIKIFFEAKDVLNTGAYSLLERTDDNAVSGIVADKFFTNAIKNSDETLRLFDQNCSLIDEVLTNQDSRREWLAGTAAPDYRTAERGNDLSWHTYSGSGSAGILGTPKAANSFSIGSGGNSQPPQLSPPPQNYSLTVSKIGSGDGTITSNLSGIDCGSNCSDEYVSGTEIKLSASPVAGSNFSGWSGDCSGSGDCILTMSGNLTATATFDLIPSSPPPSAPPKIEVTEIMYNLPGSDTGREWIEILNSGSEPVGLADWRFWEANTNHNLSVVQGSSVLAVGERAVIVIDSAKFLLDNAGYSGTIFDSSFSLSNTGETIGLKNGEGILIDEVTYSSNTGGFEDGNSLQKNGGTWVAAVPTPGQ